MDEIIHEELIEWLLSSQESVFTSSSSSEDSEEEHTEKIIKVTNFVEEVVPNYNSKTFKQHFRLSHDIVYRLIEKYSQSDLQPRYTSLNISGEKCLLVFIWYLANTESFRQVADRFNISLSSAYRVIIRVTSFILSLHDKYIKWPNNQEKLKISGEFEKKQGFVGVIGCIDGTHLKICRPQTDEEAYVNRKGYHSLLLQGIVDSRMLFLNVYCGEPGSLHDARLLRKSEIYTKAEDPNVFGNYYLLGDSAYPSLHWIVTPFKDTGNLSEKQKQFNFKLSSTRIVVEHAFGLLKGRFRRIRNFENIHIKLIVRLIMASCILHNICILKGDDCEVYKDDNNDISEFESEQITVNLDRRQEIFELLMKENN